MDEPELRCSGQLAFGPWWLLYSGPIEPMEPHAHHAFQIVVYAGRACVVYGRDLAMPGPIVLVDPYEPHRFVDQSDPVLIAFVDPDSTVGDLLASHGAVSKGPPPLISEKRLGFAHPGTWQQAEETVHRMLASVCNPSVTGSIRSWRDPSIDAASTALASLVEDSGVTSPGRRVGNAVNVPMMTSARRLGPSAVGYDCWTGF